MKADDYVCKPFSPRELAARVKAILRRQNHVDIDQKRRQFSGLLINLDERRVFAAGEELQLSLKNSERIAKALETM